MYNTTSKQRTHQQQRAGAWSKLVALCTKTVGGYYRSNGTVVRSTNGIQANHEDSNVDFASLNDRTHARVRHQETLRQENIESVLSMVSEKLSGQIVSREVDDDWSNAFFNYVQDISNKTMQSLWANAMVCELQHPGAISKRTLGFLHNCDAWEISAFRKVTAYAFTGSNGHPFIFRSVKHAHEDDVIFEESRLLSHCINAGLITAELKPLTVGDSFFYMNERQKINHGFSAPGTEVGFYLQAYTKIGSDVFKLMGGMDGLKKGNLQRRLVWEYILDFIEIESEQSVMTATA